MKLVVGIFIATGIVAALSLVFLFVMMALAGITLVVLVYGLVALIRQERRPAVPDWLVSRRQVVDTLPERIRGDFLTARL